MTSIIACIATDGDSYSANSTLPSYHYQAVDRTTWGDKSADSNIARSSWRSYNASPKTIGVNFAVSGSRIVDLTGRIAAMNALLPANKGGRVSPVPRKYILSVLVGTNPSGSDGVAMAGFLATYLDIQKVAGWDAIMVGTLVSRGDGIIGDFETYRQDFNTTVRTLAWRTAHGPAGRPIQIFDLGASATIGAAPSGTYGVSGTGYNNSTYFQNDGIHLNATGQGVAKVLWAATRDAVIAGF